MVRAVEAFKEMLVNVVGHVRTFDLIVDKKLVYYAQKAKLSTVFRRFLRNESGILCPTLMTNKTIAVLELGEDSEFENAHPFFLALSLTQVYHHRL